MPSPWALRGAKLIGLVGLRVAFHPVDRVRCVHWRRGRFEDAAVPVGGSRPNLPPYGLDPVLYATVEARCAEALGIERFDRLAAKGEAMTHDELVSLGARCSTS